MPRFFSYRYNEPPPTVEVLYTDTPVAELTLNDGLFTFRYLPAFRRFGLAPIPGFPTTAPEKKYMKQELWPFFSQRIPDRRRPEIRMVMEQLGLVDANELRLLAELGAHSVTDPYTLRLRAA